MLTWSHLVCYPEVSSHITTLSIWSLILPSTARNTCYFKQGRSNKKYTSRKTNITFFLLSLGQCFWFACTRHTFSQMEAWIFKPCLYIHCRLIKQKISITHLIVFENNVLRKKYQNAELFLVRIFLYSVRIKENTDQK